MRFLLLAVLLLAACQVEGVTEVLDDFEKSRPPAPRPLVCPGNDARDICVLFKDASVAVLSPSEVTNGVRLGVLRTKNLYFPVTSAVADSSLFYLCSAVDNREAIQTLSIAPGTPREARLHFERGSWETARFTVQAAAYARTEFPAETTITATENATGAWVISPSDNLRSIRISALDRLLLISFTENGDPCEMWYPAYFDIRSTQRFHVITGGEAIPEAYASTYGYFTNNFMAGAITTSGSSMTGEPWSATISLTRKRDP